MSRQTPFHAHALRVTSACFHMPLVPDDQKEIAMRLFTVRHVIVFFAVLLVILNLSLIPVDPVKADIEKDFDVEVEIQKDFLDDENIGGSMVYTTYIDTQLVFVANEYEGDNYAWDFGNGFSNDTGSSTYRYTYSQTNTEGYTVSLNITKGEEQANSSATVIILPRAEARFEVKDKDGKSVTPKKETIEGSLVDVYQLKKNEKITFDASTSTGYELKGYEWDFWVLSGQFRSDNPLLYGHKNDVETTKFTYKTTGLFPVMLRVKDDNKQADDSDITYIRISGGGSSENGGATLDISFLMNPLVLGGIGGLVLVIILAVLWRNGYIYFPSGGGSSSSSTSPSSSSEMEYSGSLDDLAKPGGGGDGSPFAGSKDSVGTGLPGQSQQTQMPGAGMPGVQGGAAPAAAAFETKKCPKCGGVIPITSNVRPLTVTCSGCGKSYKLKDEGEKNEPAAPSSEGVAFPLPASSDNLMQDGIQRIPADAAELEKMVSSETREEGPVGGTSPMGAATTAGPAVAKKRVKKVAAKTPFEVKKCPRCSGKIPIYSNKRPMKVECPNCRNAFLLKDKTAARRTAGRQTRAPAPAAGGADVQDIAICPNCGTPTPVGSNTSSVVCESCRFNFQI